MDKTKRRYEGVTQEMVDNMIVDEISKFATECLQRPVPGKVKNILSQTTSKIDSSMGPARKRKTSSDGARPTPLKNQKLMGPTSTSDEAIDLAVQSILPCENSLSDNTKLVSTSGRAGQENANANVKLRMVPPAQSISSTANNKPVQSQQKRILNSTSSRPATPIGSTQVVLKSSQPSNSFSPTKYTIVKSSTPVSSSQNSSYAEASGSDVSGSNIYDMPIVFADSEGNIDDESAAANDDVISVSSGESPPSLAKKVVIKSTQLMSNQSTPQFTITKNKNILIQKSAAGKMLMINGTVIGKPMTASNIVLPRTQLNQPPFKMQKLMTGMRIVTHTTQAKPPPSGKKIEILNNQIIRPASTNLNKTSSFINLADAKINMGRLSLPISTTTSTTVGGKNQIIIKQNALKPYTGLVGQQANKQIGNLTVKRLVMPPTVPTVPTTISAAAPTVPPATATSTSSKAAKKS